jgi:hypothetical protein
MAEVDEDTQMEVFDTVHDFCKSERGEGNAKGDKRIDWMRGYILSLINTLYPTLASKDLNTMLSVFSGNHVTAVSKLEHQTVEYFESEYSKEINANMETKEVLTYDTILSAWVSDPNEKTNPLWAKYRTNQEVTILELTKGKKYPDGFSESEKAVVGNFILNYFFGPSLVAEGIGASKNVRVTFDAKTGVPGKIFTRLDQVKNIMFPQTIADSATTSLNILNGRNEYIFPSPDGKKSRIQSNTFTKETYTMEYENNGFSAKNPYGFSFNVSQGAAKSIKAPFGSNQKEGPSVNYIIDLLKLAFTGGKDVSFKSLDKDKKSTILSIGKAIDSNAAFKAQFIAGVKATTDGMLADVKRSGDHETVLAAKVARLLLSYYLIYITIDILCALKSRKEGNPTIWHNGDRLILYRFPLSEAAAYEAKRENLLGKLRAMISILEKFLFISQPDTLASLQSQSVAFAEGTKGYFELKRQGKPLEPFMESIVTMLGRIRMHVLFEQAKKSEEIFMEAIKSDTRDYTNDLKFFKSVLEDQKAAKQTMKIDFATNEKSTATLTVKGKVENLSEKIETYTAQSKALSATLQDILSIDATEIWNASEKRFKKLFEIKKDIYTIQKGTDGVNKVVFKNEAFASFGFYPDAFLDLYEKLITLSSITDPSSIKGITSSGLRKLNASFDKALEEYSKAADVVLDQFPQDNALSNELFELLHFQRVPEPEGLKGDAKEKKRASIQTYLAPVAGATLLQKDIEAVYTATVEGPSTDVVLGPLVKAGGQRGGAEDKILQHYDLSYLLFDTVAYASSFIESSYMTFYTEFALWSLHNQLVDDVNIYNKDDIGFLHSSFKNLYSSVEVYIEKLSVPAETAKFTKIKNPFTAEYSKEDIVANLEILRELLEVQITGKPEPTLIDFFEKLSQTEYLESALITLGDMMIHWNEGLNEIKYNNAYDYVKTVGRDGINVENLISFLVSLDENAVSLYSYDDPSFGEFNPISAPLLSLYAKEPEKRLLIPLFGFAALENIMNTTKTYVLVKTRNGVKKTYSAPAEWETNLKTYLLTFIPLFLGKLDERVPLAERSFPIEIPELNMGGRRKSYPKRTRKAMQKQAKHSKRKTRRSKTL